MTCKQLLGLAFLVTLKVFSNLALLLLGLHLLISKEVAHGVARFGEW
jgi:hypothetical protein